MIPSTSTIPADPNANNQIVVANTNNQVVTVNANNQVAKAEPEQTGSWLGKGFVTLVSTAAGYHATILGEAYLPLLAFDLSMKGGFAGIVGAPAAFQTVATLLPYANPVIAAGATAVTALVMCGAGNLLSKAGSAISNAISPATTPTALKA